MEYGTKAATLTLYDCKGRKMAGIAGSGRGGFNWDAAKAPAGVYLAKAGLGGKSVTRWVTVLK